MAPLTCPESPPHEQKNLEVFSAVFKQIGVAENIPKLAGSIIDYLV